MNKIVLTLLTLLFLNTASFSKIITDNVKIKIPPNFYTYEFTLKELINVYPFLKEFKEYENFKGLSNIFDLNTRVIIITNNKNKVEFFKNIIKDYKFLDSPKFNFLKIELDKITKSKDATEILSSYFAVLKKLEFYNDKTMWIYVGNMEIKNLDNINISTFKNELKSEIIKFEKDTTANFLGYKVINIDVNQNYFNEMVVNLDFGFEKPDRSIEKVVISFKNKRTIMATISCYINCEYTDSLFNNVLQPSLLLQKFNYIKTDNVKQDKDIPKQLEELNNLYKLGALTEKEFKAAKAKILQ